MTVPIEMPVTTPPEETDALELLTLHVPPLAVLDSVIVEPVLTVEAPVIVPADDVVFTVAILVAIAVPQLVATA